MIRFDTKKDMEHYDNLYEEIYAKDKQIQELTNNWNELEEWLKEQSGDISYSYKHTLWKMNEIKEGSNE